MRCSNTGTASAPRATRKRGERRDTGYLLHTADANDSDGPGGGSGIWELDALAAAPIDEGAKSGLTELARRASNRSA